MNYCANIAVHVSKAQLIEFIRSMGNSPVNMVENEHDPRFIEETCGCLFVQYVKSLNPNTSDYCCSAGGNYCCICDMNDREIAVYYFECDFNEFGLPETFDGFKV